MRSAVALALAFLLVAAQVAGGACLCAHPDDGHHHSHPVAAHEHTGNHHHHGAPAISAGLESAHLVHDAVREARHADDAGRRLIAHLGPALMGVERVLDGIAHDERVHYAGIDTSPAPLGSVSIGAAIETLSGSAFGDAGTLDSGARARAHARARDPD